MGYFKIKRRFIENNHLLAIATGDCTIWYRMIQLTKDGQYIREGEQIKIIDHNQKNQHMSKTYYNF